MASGAQQVAGRVDPLARVIPLGQRGDEDADDLIADELVDDRVVRDQGCGSGGIETIHVGTEVGHGHRLGQLCRTANVGEQQRAVDLGALPIPIQIVEALGAVLRVPGPWAVAHEPLDLPAG